MILPLIVLLACTCMAWGEEICCDEIPGLCFNDDDPFDHIPLPECPDDIQISTMVYTRSNREDGQGITRTTIPPAWDASKRTHLIVHGWLGNKDNNWMHHMKDAALNRGDYNIIVTGWEESSQQIWYPRSASDTRSVGAHIAAIFDNLVRNGGANPADFYCTGHSLGSHICGHTGAYSQSLFGFTIGRITGMDPAGPLFEGKDWEVGLNPTCASYVDNMHTHGEKNVILALGTMKVLGHVDFYPNKGDTQPGCILDPYDMEVMEVMEVMDDLAMMGPDLTPACSHMRALDYYLESIESPCFHSRYLCTDQHNLPGSCQEYADAVQTMGFDADAPGFMTSGIFYLETDDETPFCLN